MVAVFVLGKTWQFKPYKWQPPELFSHGASLPPRDSVVCCCFCSHELTVLVTRLAWHGAPSVVSRACPRRSP